MQIEQRNELSQDEEVGKLPNDTTKEEDSALTADKPKSIRGSYYYDDATGYEVYNPEEEQEDESNDQSEQQSN